MRADEVIDRLCMLSAYSGDFRLTRPPIGGSLVIWRRYHHELELTVLPGVKRTAQGFQLTDSKILLVLRRPGGREVLSFTDTEYREKHPWLLELRDKIQILHRLVVNAPLCGNCGVKMTPRRRPRDCNRLEYHCWQCKQSDPVSFSSDIAEERLYRFLKKLPPKGGKRKAVPAR